eukprot:scaffold7029_cov375-Pinguiococcus_pyrenoidosus.AAC.7
MLWRNLRSAAESGWDFSSRWTHPRHAGSGTAFSLASTDVLSVVPIDLNAMLFKSLHALATMVEQVMEHAGRPELGSVAQAMRDKARDLGSGIKALLFDQDSSLFLDLWTRGEPPAPDVRGPATAACVVAAWAGLYEDAPAGSAEKLRLLLERKDEIGPRELRCRGGLQTTAAMSGEQWDAPNAWPPLQHMAVEGLKTLGFWEDAKQLAEDWLESTHDAWLQTSAMFEKMDARQPGRGGGGGEYVIQEGFGWSNGVALCFLLDFATGEEAA